jgi:hypothetical protein
VPRVDDHAAVVGVARHAVAVAERRADLVGMRIVELEPRVQVAVVVRQVADVVDLGLGVVARVGLVPPVDPGGTLPALVRQVAVDRDGTRPAADSDLVARQCRLGGDGR